jgi:hypothetical protein
MDRRIVEMLRQGMGVKAVARGLQVSKNRVRRLRGMAQEYGYLGPGGGPGAVDLPPYPEAVFPDPRDGRSQKTSEEHLKLAGIGDWIKERLEVGWQPITVFEELPPTAAGGYVRFDNKYYAAGEGFRGKTIVVIADSKQVALYHEGKLLEVHGRITDPRVTKAVKPHQLKPWERTIQDGAFYCRRAEAIGPNVRAWVEEVLKQGQGFVDTRRVRGVLSLEERYGWTRFGGNSRGHFNERQKHRWLNSRSRSGSTQISARAARYCFRWVRSD